MELCKSPTSIEVLSGDFTDPFMGKMGDIRIEDVAYVLAGADPYEKDQLGSTQKLKLTLEQMNRRNEMIYEFLKKRNTPQAWLMAGGYGDHAWEVYPAILTHVLLDRLPGPAPTPSSSPPPA